MYGKFYLVCFLVSYLIIGVVWFVKLVSLGLWWLMKVIVCVKIDCLFLFVMDYLVGGVDWLFVIGCNVGICKNVYFMFVYVVCLGV